MICDFSDFASLQNMQQKNLNLIKLFDVILRTFFIEDIQRTSWLISRDKKSNLIILPAFLFRLFSSERALKIL